MNQKITSDQCLQLESFAMEYFSYHGPEKKEVVLEQYMKEREITLSVRQARRIMVGERRPANNGERLYQKAYAKSHPWARVLMQVRMMCLNPKVHAYRWHGGRGIKCFLTIAEIRFLWNRDNASMMRKPSLERLDPNSHYVLRNCRFIEKSDDARQARRLAGSQKSRVNYTIISPNAEMSSNVRS